MSWHAPLICCSFGLKSFSPQAADFAPMTVYRGVVGTGRVSGGKRATMAAEGDDVVSTNKVDYLLLHPFSLMSLEEKFEVKRLQRHCPNDIETKQKDSWQNPKFCVTWFKQKDWLTASGGDTVWTQQGIVDLKHLSYKIKKNEFITSHIGNSKKLSLLGKVNYTCKLDKGPWPVLFLDSQVTDHLSSAQVAKYTSKASQNESLIGCQLFMDLFDHQVPNCFHCLRPAPQEPAKHCKGTFASDLQRETERWAESDV